MIGEIAEHTRNLRGAGALMVAESVARTRSPTAGDAARHLPALDPR